MSDRFDVYLLPHAQRDLKGLANPDLERIEHAVKELATASDPRTSANTKKLKGTGKVYSKRVGNFRILFEIDDAKRQIHVLRAGDRKDIYKNP